MSMKAIKKNLLLILVISTIYVTAIAFFTKFSILYGSDNPGIYSIGDLNINVITPDILLETLGILLAEGNIIIGFYIYLIASTFITLLSVSYFSKTFLKAAFPNRKIEFPFVYLTVLLYLLIPTALAWTYFSILRDASLSYAFIFVFFALTFELYYHLRNEKKVSLYYPIGLGVSLAFSALSPPNGIRIILVFLLILTIFLLLGVKTLKFKHNFPYFITSFLVFFSSFVLAYSYYLLTFLSNFSQFIDTIKSAYINLSAASNYYGTFDYLQNSVRLLSVSNWYVNPFKSIYFSSNNIIYFASYIWPLFSLLIPIYFLIRRKFGDNRFLLANLFIVALSIFLISSYNTPLMPVTNFIYEHIPFGIELIPPNFLTDNVLSKIYLVTFISSIIVIGEHLKGAHSNPVESDNKHKSPFRIVKPKWKFPIFVILVFIILLTSSMPLINGEAYNVTWDGLYSHPPNVPKSCFEAKQLMEKHNLTPILFPLSCSYIATDFGYKGSISFYQEFFYPVNVITISNFNGVYANESSHSIMVNLTHPVTLRGNSTTLDENWLKLVDIFHINSILYINDISFGTFNGYSYSNSSIEFLLEKNYITQLPLNSGNVSIYIINLNLLQ